MHRNMPTGTNFSITQSSSVCPASMLPERFLNAAHETTGSPSALFANVQTLWIYYFSWFRETISHQYQIRLSKIGDLAIGPDMLSSRKSGPPSAFLSSPNIIDILFTSPVWWQNSCLQSPVSYCLRATFPELLWRITLMYGRHTSYPSARVTAVQWYLVIRPSITRISFKACLY